MTAPGPAAKTFRLDGSYTAINRLYQERGWTDGLPIVPPTDDEVREFLRFTDRDPRDVENPRNAIKGAVDLSGSPPS